MTSTSPPNPPPADPPPTVSVLMSVYNGGSYLAPAVESILSQTYRDFELVVVDDGSTDASAATLRVFARRDPRLRLVVRPNKGLTKTLNEAYALSRGRYLARMDCDDVAHPDRLATQVAFMDANPLVACCGGYFQLIDGAGRLLTTLRPPTGDVAIQSNALRGHTSICHPAAMIRRSALDRVKGYDERFKTSQDLDLWLRLGEVGQLANVPAVVLKFRLHEGSVSETKREEQRRFSRMAVEEAWQRRNTPVPQRVFEAGDPWRPGKDRESRHKYALQYGWWAFNSGQRKTAVIYGGKAIAARPLKFGGWWLTLLAAVKPMRAEAE